MKKFLIFLISLCIGIAIFVWIVKSVGLAEIKKAFFAFSFSEGITIFLLTILVLFIGAWKWQLILKNQGYNISLKELIVFSLGGFAILFFVPIFILGGEFFKSYVLKERKNVPWPKAIASVIIDRILEWTLNLILVLGGIGFFIVKISRLPPKLETITAVFLALIIVGLIFFYLKSFRKESILKIFIKPTKKNDLLEIEKEVFRFFKPKKMAMWQVFSVNFLRSMVIFFRCWLVILFLGKNLALFPILSILGFEFLSVLVPIPGGLGSHDVLQALSFNSLGLGANTGTVFAIIIRVAELGTALVGAIFLLWLGSGLLRDVLLKKMDTFLNLVRNSKK